MNIIGLIAHIPHVFLAGNVTDQAPETVNVISSLLPFFFMLLIVTVFVVVRFVRGLKEWKKIMEDEKKPYKKKIPKKKHTSRKW